MREEVDRDFAGFSDRPESPFYRSEGISAVETWDRSVDSMAALLLELSSVAHEQGFRFTADLLCDWHSRIFGELFPEDAGRFRWRREGEWEHVFFGGNVGTARSRRTKEYRGVHPKKLRKRVDEICEEFNASRASLVAMRPGSASLDVAAHAVAKLYAKLLRAHPWVDGNLRVAFVALQAALLSLDLPRVMFPDLERHDDLIGVAFRNDNAPYLQLANYIADDIRERGD